MSRITPKILFIVIIALAIFLRFWQLGTVPISPDWDEAALGYNAYSILHTGKDEYGVFLPRELRSYDDYKPPLYAYLAVPSIAMFGLNTRAVRIPSAVMGVLAVVGTYYLVLALFRHSRSVHEKKKEDGIDRWNIAQSVALLAALMLAISPWHLQFSRIAFEANSGITLNIWGLVAFFYGLSSLPMMALSAFFFGLGLYAYHSERVFVPLLVLSLAIIWRKELFRDWRKVAVGLIVGLVTVLPLLPVVTDKTAMTRLRGTSPLSDQTRLLMRTVKKLEADAKAGDTLGALIDNRRVVYAKTLIDGYISHFSLQWLFLTGDNDRHHAPDNGILYLWEIPFIFLGLLWIWKRGGKLRSLLTVWVLIAPVAASPTGGTPHAIRTLVFLPTFQIFTALGLYAAWAGLKKHISKAHAWASLGYLVIACIAAFGIFFITIYYFHMYYHQMNREYSQNWQYGYQQAVSYAEAHKSKYTKIVVSTALEQPHMFFLFFTGYDPVKYLAQGGTASGGFNEVRNHFDLYEFRRIGYWLDEIHDGKTLYIGTPSEIQTSTLTSIRYLNGVEAIRIAE